MDYLWWNVPWVTAPMLIALIATVHVFVSHYAVGGGIFLAWETGKAYKAKDEEYLRYLRSHAKFFILLTVVFGAITGVGIWWTIGLASPLATETLIRTFVFGWATEWVFFVVELVAGFLFYYRWGKLDPKTHVAFGWIYAIAAWISLVLITGITAFMLQPGAWTQATQAGTGTPDFWRAFFNPQFLPQTVARSGFALVLAASYVLLHASWKLDATDGRSNNLRQKIIRHAGIFAGIGLMLALLGVVWGLGILPKLTINTIFRAAALNIFAAVGLAAALLLTGLLAAAAWKPRWITPLAAVAIFAMALGVLTASEFVREAIRKPFVIVDTIYSNQIHVGQVEPMRERGLLESGAWTKTYIQEKFPHLIDPQDGTIQFMRMRDADRVPLGRVVFMHHCNDCHAEEHGYSGMKPLIITAGHEELVTFVKNLDSMVYYMPPWCGNDEEAELLVNFLEEMRGEK